VNSYLAFNSLGSLTGYDNHVAGSGERAHEIFLYDAAHNKLACASCDPSGAPPTHDLTTLQDARIELPIIGEQAYVMPMHLGHELSDTGQVFFSTAEPLVEGDHNGVKDVYEYSGGRVSLISSGTGSDPALFRDASVSGGDVFFITAQALVGSDTDNSVNVYDARVNGGLAEPPAPPAPCGGEEACLHASPAAPSFSAPASALFSGQGNPIPPTIVPPPPKPPTLSQRLAKARAACRRAHRHSRRLRVRCERQARRRYSKPTKGHR
jgi:hypothetical protein